jgi:hypothetical protein
MLKLHDLLRYRLILTGISFEDLANLYTNYLNLNLVQARVPINLFWTTGVRSPTETEDFSSNLFVQTGSGAHPFTCTMGTDGCFLGDKARPGHDADHSPPSNAGVMKE